MVEVTCISCFVGNYAQLNKKCEMIIKQAIVVSIV